jgi:hypothetical protein
MYQFQQFARVIGLDARNTGNGRDTLYKSERERSLYLNYHHPLWVSSIVRTKLPSFSLSPPAARPPSSVTTISTHSSQLSSWLAMNKDNPSG